MSVPTKIPGAKGAPGIPSYLTYESTVLFLCRLFSRYGLGRRGLLNPTLLRLVDSPCGKVDGYANQREQQYIGNECPYSDFSLGLASRWSHLLIRRYATAEDGGAAA